VAGLLDVEIGTDVFSLQVITDSIRPSKSGPQACYGFRMQVLKPATAFRVREGLLLFQKIT
jgi:hypothetical protein